VAATALAILAFLSAGYTNRGDHPFAPVVHRAAAWLKGTAQHDDGLVLLSSHATWLWDHALATLALVELYGTTESKLYREPAVRALQALVRHRGAARGTWSSEDHAGDVEEALTLWAALPLLAAKFVHEDQARHGTPPGLPIYADEIAGVLTWIAKHTDPETRLLRLGARHEHPGLPGSSQRGLQALALWVRVSACRDPLSEDPLARGRTALRRLPDTWDPGAHVDPVFTWAATKALAACGGDAWKRWDADALPGLVETRGQEGEPCGTRGSWAPAGELGRATGRVGTTALLFLAQGAFYWCYPPAACEK